MTDAFKLIVAQVLVVFLVVYETIGDFRDYRAGKIGAANLTGRLVLLALVAYILTDLVIRIYVFPRPL